MNLQDMKEAAKLATPGPWVVGQETVFHEPVVLANGGCLTADVGPEDAVHIANCSPDQILAMIAVCEAAEKLIAHELRGTGVGFDLEESLAALEAMP